MAEQRKCPRDLDCSPPEDCDCMELGWRAEASEGRALPSSSVPISPPSPAETPQTTPAVRDKVCRHGYLGGCPVCDLPPAPPTETQTATPDDESLDFIFGGTDRIREAQSGSPRAAQPATTELNGEWCTQTFYRVNPGARSVLPRGLASLYLLDFARAVLAEFSDLKETPPHG